MSESVAVVRHQRGGGLSDPTTFDIISKQAVMLSKSTIVPETYQNQPSNCLVALEYAYRLQTSVLAVMQNLDVIHGRPGLRSTFLIGTVNASGRFTPLRFRFQGTEGKDDWGCRAVAKDKATGEELVGPLITIGLAKAEGWYDRKGSKWKTSPELMLTYRGASWWVRIFAPEMALGLQTADEVEDVEYTAPAPKRHEEKILQALHADDPAPAEAPKEEPKPDPTGEAGPVVEGEIEIEGEEVVEEEGDGTEGAEPAEYQPPTKLATLHKRYVAALQARGMDGDSDRVVFQDRLQKQGLVPTVEWEGWGRQHYLEAITEIEAIPVAEGAEA